jgi:hypothetical protein
MSQPDRVAATREGSGFNLRRCPDSCSGVDVPLRLRLNGLSICRDLASPARSRWRAQKGPDAVGAFSLWAVLGSNQDDRLREVAKQPMPIVRSPARSGWRAQKRPRRSRSLFVVGGTGIEPATSSVSGKRATAAPTAPRSYFSVVNDSLLLAPFSRSSVAE